MSASTSKPASASKRFRFEPFGPVLLLLVGHIPFLLGYFQQLGRYDHYGFYPLVFLFCAYLVYDRLDRDRFQWTKTCTALVIFDLLLVVAGVVVRSPWPVWAGLLLGLSACGFAARDKQGDGNLSHAVLPLFVLLRPPFAGDLRLVEWLQSNTTLVASRVLHRLNIVHFRSGNVLELPDKRLLVEEACSGIQSLFAIVFVALAIIALKRRRLIHASLLVGVSLIWAGAFNVIRVLTIAVAWDRYEMDLSAGTSHTVLGYIVLALATILTFSADQLLSCFTDQVPAVSKRGLRRRVVVLWNRFIASRQLEAQPEPKTNKAAPVWLRSQWAAIGLAVVLAGSQLYAGAGTRIRRAVTSKEAFQQKNLPANLGSWEQESFATTSRNAANSLGEFSNSWVYTGTGSSAFVSCDHPFEGWHDLEVCYQGQGWLVEERNIIADDDWPCVEVIFSKPTGDNAYLVYSLFDTAGAVVVPPRQSVSASLVNRVLRKARLGDLTSQNTIQSQIFVETAVRIDAEQRVDLIRKHRVVREALRTSYRGNSND